MREGGRERESESGERGSKATGAKKRKARPRSSHACSTARVCETRAVEVTLSLLLYESEAASAGQLPVTTL